MADADQVSRADIHAVSRTSQILGLFSVDHTELVTVDVAEALGLNRTTTHRYLTSMAAVGLLEPGSRHSSYVVGPLATRLGAVATGSASALAVAPRYTPTLSDELGATVTLSVWASTGPMVVHVAEPAVAEAVLSVRVGTVLPVNSAHGVLYAAFGVDPARVDARCAGLGRAERAAFDAHVREVRDSGVATMHHHDVGIVAVAAPVRDPEGVCAAVAAVGLVGSLTEAAVPRWSASVRETAEQMTAELGGTVR
jgi:DNA-binding IclR family transcriptional regulator